MAKRKKIVAVFAAGIFLFSSSANAQPKISDEFKFYAQEVTEEDFPPVDAPFAKSGQSVTINRTEKKLQERTSTPPPDPEPEPIPIEPLAQPEENPPDGEGLEFLVYQENGVQAFAIIAAHEQYKLLPVLAGNRVRGLATVMQISQNLNDIATINASYFAPSGSLYGVTKIDGEIVAGDYFIRSAIGINFDGSTIFGKIKYVGKIILPSGASVEINGVNCPRESDRIIVYNDRFADSTGTNSSGTEIILDGGGIVTEVRHSAGNSSIPKNGHVISSLGSTENFFSEVQVGDKIIFDEKILSDDADFDSAIHVLGAGPRLVNNGSISVTADEEQFPADIRVGRAPRSAVGVTKYGDFILAVVDGRQSHSRGCTLQEWAEILLNHFGAFNAINLDGGGSTELVVKEQLVNSPSDGSERAVGSALAILPK